MSGSPVPTPTGNNDSIEARDSGMKPAIQSRLNATLSTRDRPSNNNSLGFAYQDVYNKIQGLVSGVDQMNAQPESVQVENMMDLITAIPEKVLDVRAAGASDQLASGDYHFEEVDEANVDGVEEID